MKDQKGVSHLQSDNSYIVNYNQGSLGNSGRMDDLSPDYITKIDHDCNNQSINSIEYDTPPPLDYYPAPENTPDYTADLYAEYIALSDNDEHSISESLVTDSSVKAVRKSISSSLDVLSINQQYLGGTIKDSLRSAKWLIVWSPMGTGKTSAMKILIAENVGAELDEKPKVLMMTPRKILNRATAKELGLTDYRAVKAAIKNKQIGDAEIIAMIERMTCTPQSLPKILKLYKKISGNDIAYDYIVMDEVEAITKMLTSNANTDKALSLDYLRKACESAGNVVMMDAFITDRARTLMKALKSGETKSSELVNTYPRWENINAVILDGKKFNDRVIASDAMQVQTARSGKPFAVVGASAAYCERRYKVLTQMFPHLNILLINTKKNPDVDALADSPALLSKYDIVISGPALDVGVSFDIPNYIHCVYGVFCNEQGTGGTDSALQALARFRHLIDNNWFIVLDSQKQVFSKEYQAITPDEIVKIMSDRYTRECFAAGVSDSGLRLDIAHIFAMNNAATVWDKNNYNDKFLAELSAMKIKVTKLNIDTVKPEYESENLTDDAKEELKAEEKKRKTESKKIDVHEFNYIEVRLEFDPDSVSQSERDSVARYKFEEKFGIDCDKLTHAEIDKFLKLDDAGAIATVIRREIALDDGLFTKRYIKARLVGAGDSEAFKVSDLLSDKLNYRLTKKIMEYAAPYFDGSPYSHESLMHSSFNQFLRRNKNEIIVTQIMPLTSSWIKKPALAMKHVLEMCGYSSKSERFRSGSGERKRQYIASGNPAIDELYSTRLSNGTNWIESTNELLDFYGTVSDKITPRMIQALQMPRVDIKFVNNCLSRIPNSMKDSIIEDYEKMYDMMNPENDGVNAPANANEWLSIQVENLARKACG